MEITLIWATVRSLADSATSPVGWDRIGEQPQSSVGTRFAAAGDRVLSQLVDWSTSAPAINSPVRV
jgi:hypothetical protein